MVMACAGGVPALEVLAAVALLRQHIPELKVRVVNVVDRVILQPKTEHPRGLADNDFDSLFTKEKPVIFAYHGYPWLIHKLAYRRTNPFGHRADAPQHCGRVFLICGLPQPTKLSFEGFNAPPRNKLDIRHPVNQR